MLKLRGAVSSKAESGKPYEVMLWRLYWWGLGGSCSWEWKGKSSGRLGAKTLGAELSKIGKSKLVFCILVDR